MLNAFIMAGEQEENPAADRVLLFILLMVTMVIGAAVTGRKGRK